MKLAPGTMVTEKVRLRKPIGRGGMGQVWVADHLTLEMPVAVKFIQHDLIELYPELLTRFEREAKTAAHIKSPHVVQIIDHGINEGTPYIVMEMLEGNTLSDWLGLMGTLSFEDTAKIVSQVAGVLDKAHRASIVHRDIKPDNIFLVEGEADLFVKVLDFGVAKRAQKQDLKKVTEHGAMLGTPYYMSPEQALSAKDVNELADLWALAVVAYEVMTGAPPFAGETLGAIVVAITAGKFEPVSRRLDQRYPPGLDAFFASAFHRRPEERFQSARELAGAFQRLALRLPSDAVTQIGMVPDAARLPATTLPAAKPALTQPAAKLPAVKPRIERGMDRAIDITATLPSAEDGATPAPRDKPKIIVEEARAPARPRAAASVRFDHAPRERTQRPALRAERMAPPASSSSQPPEGLASNVSKEHIAVLVIVVATSLVMPFFEPLGRGAIEDSMPSAPYAPFAIAALLFIVGGAKVWDRPSMHTGWVRVAAAGMLVLGGALGATAAMVGAPSLGLEHHAVLIESAGALGAAAIPLGFAVFGGLRAADELTRSRRNVSYGLVLVVMAILGLGAAYQLARRPLGALLSQRAGSVSVQRVG